MLPAATTDVGLDCKFLKSNLRGIVSWISSVDTLNWLYSEFPHPNMSPATILK